MAEVTDMWFYVQNTEYGPVLPATDALFEERSGMSRKQALEQHPTGGEWVDTWLVALQEAGDHARSTYYGALTGVMLGMPGNDSHQGISETDWRDLYQRVMKRYDDVSHAVDAWQFVSARTNVSLLWDSMVELFPHSDHGHQGGRIEDWADLRPLFQ
jgi:hypothetical protein